jgi:hypothetical protein
VGTAPIACLAARAMVASGVMLVRQR